jgi:hypothetical protein
MELLPLLLLLSSSSSSSYGGGGYRRQAVKLPILALPCTPPPPLAAAVPTTPICLHPSMHAAADANCSFGCHWSSSSCRFFVCADDKLLWLLSADI